MTKRAPIFSGFFQLGYVASDIDAACETYNKKFGLSAFQIIDMPIDENNPSPIKRIALTYVDDMMIEIIQPDLSLNTIYDDSIVDNPNVIRLHHLGYYIDDYQKTLKRLHSLDYDIPAKGGIPGVLEYCYADTRKDTGLFSEFVRLDDGGKDFFANVPRYKSKK